MQSSASKSSSSVVTQIKNPKGADWQDFGPLNDNIQTAEGRAVECKRNNPADRFRIIQRVTTIEDYVITEV